MAGKILDQSVSFLIDSGASCSLIDISVYQSLKMVSSIKLSPVEENFVMADGSGLTTLGEANVGLQVGDTTYPLTVIVADLGGRSAILGLDFIEENDITLKLSRGRLVLGGETVLLHRENAKKGCCRISVGHTLSIPPRSCRVVAMEVDIGVRPVDRKVARGICAVECLPTLAEATGLVMDPGLVRVQDGKVPVNLINVHDEPIHLHKGKTLGSIHPVKTVSDCP